MSDYIRWNSQPLDSWASKYAKGKFVDLDGKKTHYIEKGEGEPVILLHGFFYDSYLWEENINFLAQKFKVYALDLWGCGYSTRDPLDYSYQLYTNQLLLFMNYLGLERASLVGQSMGGGTAMMFCLQHRHRVNKLLLVDPAGLPNSLPLAAKFVNLPRVGEFFMGLSVDALRRDTLSDIFIHNKELVTDEYFENVTRFHKVNGTVESILSIQRENFFDTLSDEINRLADVDVEILIVWGREDKGIPLSRGQEMHRILKHSRLVIIDNAGHVPNFECSGEFNRIAVEFLCETVGNGINKSAQFEEVAAGV
ncbi:MAG: alpha/beta hydrolase [Moraxellaceae bacterium]|nr:MAG: alpha/beta hydrolase [Moraxellaceae bacterium]